MNPWIIVGALVLCIAAWFGGTRSGHNAAEAEYNVKLTEATNAALTKQNEAVEQERLRGDARVKTQTDIATAAQARADSNASAADAARDSIARLQKRVTDLVAAATRARGADPATPAAVQTAQDADVLLAGLLDKSLERNRQLAAFADDAHNRGLACERSYDALTVSAPVSPTLH